jgi:predicted methyltransferase
MAKTTVDIDDRLMKEIRALSRREGVSLKEALERLVTAGLRRGTPEPARKKFMWKSSSSPALVDIRDKDALYGALEKGK